MTFKNYRLNTIVRILLIALSFFLLFKTIDSEKYIITPIVLAFLIIIQTITLIVYTEKNNRHFINFLQAIKFQNYTSKIQIEGLGTSFDDLQKEFNAVLNEYQQIKNDKEKHNFYLQNIIEHIDIAILVYNFAGEILIINRAAKNLFEVSEIDNISNLSEWNEELKNTLLEIKANEDKLLKIIAEDDLMQLSIHCDEFIIQNQKVKLVSIKNIQTELEAKEIDAWQKLIRVLTHEIMNSIAPISSLASTVNTMIEDITVENGIKSFNNHENEAFDDIKKALETIKNRSEGLIHFVETYRNLTKIPKPDLSIFEVKNLLLNVVNLFETDFKEKNIEFEISVIPENLKITADEKLIEQVLINLVKNSLSALETRQNKSLILKSFIDNKARKLIQICDNGEGIIPDVLEKIFIPFFSTKQNGTGIGLSLSRQIMRLHGGSITVFSEPEKQTIFTLSF